MHDFTLPQSYITLSLINSSHYRLLVLSVVFDIIDCSTLHTAIALCSTLPTRQRCSYPVKDAPVTLKTLGRIIKRLTDGEVNIYKGNYVKLIKNSKVKIVVFKNELKSSSYLYFFLLLEYYQKPSVAVYKEQIKFDNEGLNDRDVTDEIARKLIVASIIVEN